MPDSPNVDTTKPARRLRAADAGVPFSGHDAGLGRPTHGLVPHHPCGRCRLGYCACGFSKRLRGRLVFLEARLNRSVPRCRAALGLPTRRNGVGAFSLVQRDPGRVLRPLFCRAEATPMIPRPPLGFLRAVQPCLPPHDGGRPDVFGARWLGTFGAYRS